MDWGSRWRWREKGRLRSGDQILEGLSMFFKSSRVNDFYTFYAVPLAALPLPLCVVYANVVLWSNSSSFLPDTLPLFSLNPVFYTETSWSQKQSCMQSHTYVNLTRTEYSVLCMENSHQWTLRWEYASVFGSFACLFFISSGTAVNYWTVDKAVTVV